MLGVDRSAVAYWENGTNTPTLANAIRLADILTEGSLDRLLGRNTE